MLSLQNIKHTTRWNDRLAITASVIKRVLTEHMTRATSTKHTWNHCADRMKL